MVLARPQFLVSSFDVIANVAAENGGPAGRVDVKEVVWPTNARIPRLIVVTNLAQCDGWRGPGAYVLPLVVKDEESYQVVSIPPSPGYPPPAGYEPDTLKPRIYPETPQVMRQLKTIHKSHE